MTADEKALRDLIARVWRMAAACGSDDATLALIRDGKHATVEGMIAALSPPATDGGAIEAPGDGYPATNGDMRPVATDGEAKATARAIVNRPPSERGEKLPPEKVLALFDEAGKQMRAAAQACATPQPRTCIAHNETMPCPVRGCVNAVRP